MIGCAHQISLSSSSCPHQCNYRYILNMSIIDDSGSTWVTAFNDQAEKLLGVTARELFEMRTSDNQAGYDKVFADCLFKPFIAKVLVCSNCGTVS